MGKERSGLREGKGRGGEGWVERQEHMKGEPSLPIPWIITPFRGKCYWYTQRLKGHPVEGKEEKSPTALTDPSL